MNLDWPFLRLVSVIADTITIAGVITTLIYSLSKRREKVIALQISLFLSYLFRTAVILIVLAALFKLTNTLYFFTLVFLKNGVSNNTYYWENGQEFFHILAYSISYSIGISFAWVFCSIIWSSSLDSAKEFINMFLPPNRKLEIQQTQVLEIVNATYGTKTQMINVTQILRQMVQDNTLAVKASNNIAGDPSPGNPKNMIIDYRIGQKLKNVVIAEGYSITLPSDENS